MHIMLCMVMYGEKKNTRKINSLQSGTRIAVVSILAMQENITKEGGEKIVKEKE